MKLTPVYGALLCFGGYIWYASEKKRWKEKAAAVGAQTFQAGYFKGLPDGAQQGYMKGRADCINDLAKRGMAAMSHGAGLN